MEADPGRIPTQLYGARKKRMRGSICPHCPGFPMPGSRASSFELARHRLEIEWMQVKRARPVLRPLELNSSSDATGFLAGIVTPSAREMTPKGTPPSGFLCFLYLLFVSVSSLSSVSCLFLVFFTLSFRLSLSLSGFLCVYLFLSLSVSLSVSVYLSLFLCSQSLALFLPLSLSSISVCPSLCLHFSVSLLSVSISVSLSLLSLSISLSLSGNMFPHTGIPAVARHRFTSCLAILLLPF